MSGTSPEAILYDSAGNLLAVQNATAIPASTPGLLVMGSDGTNSRYILVDSSGRPVLVGAGVAGTPAGGVVSIQGVAGGTVVPTSVSGTVTISGTVTANIGTTGGLALDTSVNGILLAQNSTTSGQTGPLIQGAVTTAAPSYTTAKTSPLSLTTAGALRIDGSAVTQPVSGTVTANAGSGNFAVVQATAANLNATVVGTVTANIGTTNGLALDATLAKLTIAQGASLGANTQALVGGSVTTAAPTYTTGQISPLSLTTAGALRTDGSGVTQPVSGTVTANIGTTNGLALDTSVNGILVSQGSTTSGEKGPLIQGAVTTASPSYTTAQTSPLSLTTAGALRIDGSATTQPVSGTVTANAGTGNFTVVQATAANLKAQTASESTTATSTGTVASLTGGAVTTAAPTYTTGQMDPLSLTTAGALRVDGSGVTQPVSGTVTANIGTTNGLALDATLAKLTIAQSTALGSNTLAMVGGSVTTASPTYTNGNINPLSLTTAGALRIDGSGVTQPVSGTVTANQGGAPWSQNITQFGGVNISTGTGASGTGIPRVTVSNDSNILATQSGTWTVQPGNTANTTPWLATINQGGNSAAVKAASTAAVATDPALVVAISPNNSISIAGSADSTASGNLNALNATVQVAVNGESNSGMQLSAGTLVGTIVPEVSLDGGTTWVGTFFDDPTTGNKVSSIVFGANNTATTRTIVSVGGASHMRVRVSAFTSGTAVCALRASVMHDPSRLSEGAAGAALPPNVIQDGGSVTTAAPSYSTGTVNALSLNTSGGLRVDGSGVTQPVSGTVTANQGTPNSLANKWPVQVTDGTNVMPTADVAARAQFDKITDGTNTAAVKAASTAAAAADPSLVVGLSPNSPLPTGTNNIGSVNNVQGTESTAAWTSSTTNNTALALTVTGYGTVTVTLNQGSTITGGSVTFEGSDTVAGTNWYPISMVSTSGATVPVSTYTLVASTNIAFQTNVAGFIQFRVRLSPVITGTGTVNVGITANASATEWQHAAYLTDGATGPVAVKAASTAPTVSDKALVVVLSPNQTSIPVSNAPSTATPDIATGYVTHSTTAKTAVIASTYNEQTTAAQRSISSSNANDTSAGTGARTVKITYYDATMAGPNTETVTMNGTTAVNTTNTNICFIESIKVVTTGTNLSNVGTITLFIGTGGAGGTLATMNVADNRTFWGNHYVASTKTCYITGLSGHNTNSSNGSVLTLTSYNPTSANSAEFQISDFVRVGGGTSQPVREYNQLIKVPGPARVRLYEACEGTPTITTRAAFDFYDQ